MKKLLLSAACITAMLACLPACKGGKQSGGQDSAQDASAKTTDSTVQKTLDGIDSATAVKMIAEFKKDAPNFKSLTGFNFLIKKDTLQKLVKLLEDEITAQKTANPNTPDTTDGIRLYFAIDPKTPATISMLAVSTMGSSVKDYHHDYYTHAASADLTRLNMQGEVGITPPASTGAALYSRCDTCKDDTSCNMATHPHYLTRALAETMVQNYTQVPAATVVQTLAEWYDFAMIKAMADDPDCDGVRIYFARHPAIVGNELSQRACFVLTTTHRFKPAPKVYKDYFSCKTLQGYFLNYEKSHPGPFRNPLSPGQDNGGLCPNICN